MTDTERLATEATRLLNDDTLAEVLDRIQRSAVAELLAADPDDKTAIIRLQVKANMTTEILDELKALVTATGKNDGGFDPNKPPA